MVILSRLEHPSKAEYPMYSTPSGISMEARLEQPEKAESPISVTESGMVMLSRLEQFKNVPDPMDSTLSPSVLKLVLCNHARKKRLLGSSLQEV